MLADTIAPASVPLSNYTNWLPNVLQLPVLYFIVALCVASVYLCREMSKQEGWLWVKPITPLVVLATGQLFAFFLIPDSHVYALGTGLICSMLSIACFPLFLNFLESWVRRILGAAPVTPMFSTPKLPTTDTKENP